MDYPRLEGHPEEFFFVYGSDIEDISNNYRPAPGKEIRKADLVDSFEKMRSMRETPADFKGLFRVRNSRRIPLGSSYIYHSLCVNYMNNFFLLPNWSKLTSRTGWIYSISRNYSDGSSNETRDLFNALIRKVSDKISTLPSNNWYPIDVIMQVVRSHIELEELTPNRSQILSTKNWRTRYLICDNPQIDLKKIEIPDSGNSNPFPMMWLVGQFMSETAEIPMPEGLAVREMNLAPTIVDILNMDDRELRKNLFDGNGHISRNCLREMGFGDDFNRILSRPNVKTKLLELSLGYKRQRREYHKHFSNIADKMDSKQMDFDIELRVSEVFEIWVQSLMEIVGFDNVDDFINLINKNSSKHKFLLKTPVDLGSVNLFVDLHRKCMNENVEYKRKIQDRLPERMNRLLTPRAQQMLEILSYLRNRNSHSRPRNKKIKKYHEQVYEKWISIIDAVDDVAKKRLIEDFYKEFYGVDKKMNVVVSSVPTLMEVVELRTTNRGSQAILNCMRNGTTHKLSTSGGGRMMNYSENGKITTGESLNIDDRLYIWATTNPTLVDPIIIRF